MKLVLVTNNNPIHITHQFTCHKTYLLPMNRFVFIVQSLLVVPLFADARPILSFLQLTPNDKTSRSREANIAKSSSRIPLVESPLAIPSSSFGSRIERFTKSNVLVQIERTAQNERRISGELVLNHDRHSVSNTSEKAHSAVGIDHLWDILTDYNNLSTHVPNLVESRIISRQGNHNFSQHGKRYNTIGTHHINDVKTSIGPRIYQKGSQRIWGFEFGADLTMDMRESIIDCSTKHSTIKRKCILDFKCVSSQFFQQFDGSWIVEEAMKPASYGSSASITTSVKYIVDVRPKGLVPVAALEWRIKEDVPTNMLGVVNAAAKKSQTTVVDRLLHGVENIAMNGEATNDSSVDWYRDETLSMYL